MARNFIHNISNSKRGAFALTKTVQVFSKGITGLYINGLYITDLVAWAKITTTWLTNRDRLGQNYHHLADQVGPPGPKLPPPG